MVYKKKKILKLIKILQYDLFRSFWIKACEHLPIENVPAYELILIFFQLRSSSSQENVHIGNGTIMRGNNKNNLPIKKLNSEAPFHFYILPSMKLFISYCFMKALLIDPRYVFNI